VVHDHPGARAPEGAWLAVMYPLPGERPPSVSAGPFELLWGAIKLDRVELLWGSDVRWDLGFLELVFTVIVATCFILTWRKRLPVGTYIVVISLAYGPVRFCMDFLRITDGGAADRRYGDLTFAQYCCLALVAFGFALLGVVRRNERLGRDVAAPVRARPSAPPEGAAVPA
jgi:phosphatidylglycerol:prolipoprotein diacylglycerol transferase